MKQAVIDYIGVLWHVKYEVAADGCVEFASVRVTGPDYAPVGPELMPALDLLAVVDMETLEASTLLGDLAFQVACEGALNGNTKESTRS